jgi:hypothetical protein
VLLQLISAEDDQFSRMKITKHDLDELMSEGSCATRNEHYFFIPIHRVNPLRIR